jgi:peptide/nickel transport system permease protein
MASACSTGDGCAGGLIQPGLTVVVFVIAIASFPYIARIIRGQVLSLREKEFVEAARSLGASDRRIIFRHILPNLVAPIIVYTTLVLPQNILFEAALSFLGVGVEPPTASWGQMIADASSDFQAMWWYMVFPGTALVLTVLAFNLVGDGLQDALNPRRRK